MREKRNAVIESTTLGPAAGNGIFSLYLTLNYGGSGQGFGGYALDKHNGQHSERSARYGTAYGMEFIRRVLETVGVEKWEDLKGKYVRVDMEFSKVHGIGHVIEEKWFYPENDECLVRQKIGA